MGKCSGLHLAPQNLVQALSFEEVGASLGVEGLAVCEEVKRHGGSTGQGTFSNHVNFDV